MTTRYTNQKFDPAGPAYKQWESDGSPDAIGTFYVGPPAFGTLTGDLMVVATEELGGGGGTDHGGLTGLGDDDHAAVYPASIGRSGGQTIAGGIDATDDLILKASSHGAATGVVKTAAGVAFETDELITGDLVMRSEERDASMRFIEHHDWIEVVNEKTGHRGKLVVEPLTELTG